MPNLDRCCFSSVCASLSTSCFCSKGAKNYILIKRHSCRNFLSALPFEHNVIPTTGRPPGPFFFAFMSLSFPEPTPSEREEKTGGEMEQREVESSPVPSSHDMPEGFQQLIDHNNNEPTSSYPPPPQDQQQAPPPTVNMHGHLKSTPQPGYASPAKEYRHPDMIYAHHDASPYSYPENNYPSNYATEQSAYPPPPETVKTVSGAPLCP